MRYQLCGPVTGRPRDEAMADFGAAREALEAAHHGSFCFDPTREVDAEETHERAMRVCIGWLVRFADALVTLHGWESSEGAALEVAVARAIGTPVKTLGEAL